MSLRLGSGISILNIHESSDNQSIMSDQKFFHWAM